MTTEQINIAIAESLGFSDFEIYKNLKVVWAEKNGIAERIPNYATDLNACHEFEINGGMHLYPERERYYPQLIEVIKRQSCDYPIWMATAPQRCEAYLRTIGLWKECA